MQERRQIVDRPVGPGPLKIVVCLPSGDSIKTRTVMSLLALFKYIGDNPQFNIDLAITNHQCSILPWGRSSCVEDALKMGADYLFWVDSDMWFPPETLTTLLEHDKDVVGCIYAMKVEYEQKPVLPYFGLKFEGVKPVPNLATGLFLCKAECFRKMVQPYFEFLWEDRYVGEDVVLSRRLRDMGYQLWCDFDLSKKVGHIGDKVYNLEGYTGEKLPPSLQAQKEKETPAG